MTYSWLRCVSAGLAVFMIAGRAAAEDSQELFNGRDLAGWVNVNCHATTWQVRDGVIVCSGDPTGVLRTEKQYENFVLELEWKHLHERGNAGLFVWSDDITARGQPFTRSIEVQIMDGNHGDVFAIHGATMTPDRPHPRGYMRCLPSEERARPAGEWNHYRVECRDGRLALAVNGKVVSGGTDCKPRKGYVCLESEGSEILFRNIRIRELPATGATGDEVAVADRGFKALFRGIDLAGWKVPPGDEERWTVDNWRIKYDGESQGEGRHLWSAEEAGDAQIIVDWRWMTRSPPAEAPVLIRGVEIPGLKSTDAKRGEWNRAEITVRGDRIDAVINGEELLKDKRVEGLPARGAIGLADRGEAVEFANVYVRELPRGLALTFKGPFAYGATLPVSNSDDAPVHVDYVLFDIEEMGNHLAIQFTFNGKKDPERVIDLEITAKDASGRVVASESERCFDMRLRPKVLPSGDVPFKVNSRGVDLGEVTPDAVTQLEIRFVPL